MKKIFVLSLLLCACTFQTKHRGYIFPDNLETEVAAVKTTAQLEEKLGSPLVKTVYGDQIWVYYSADENHHGPFRMTWDNRTVLLAWVDPSPGGAAAGGGRVGKIKILRDADLPKIAIDDGETPIPAAIELNALEELVNNIGRFTPAGLGQ